MIHSMTGFGSRERISARFGKMGVEIRSINHKSLEFVFRLPDGFLSLEDRIKKEIESVVRRGRITCSISTSAGNTNHVFINRKLLKNYVHEISHVRKEFKLDSRIGLEALLHLPGVVSLAENKLPVNCIWPELKSVIQESVKQLIKAREREGRALEKVLRSRTKNVQQQILVIKERFQQAIAEKTPGFETDEERANFLKSADIAEEIDRLSFHAVQFQRALLKAGAVGKELDFIAQEMQREANTMGAKSFDTVISGKVVSIKSLIEKIREQVQNIE